MAKPGWFQGAIDLGKHDAEQVNNIAAIEFRRLGNVLAILVKYALMKMNQGSLNLSDVTRELSAYEKKKK